MNNTYRLVFWTGLASNGSQISRDCTESTLANATQPWKIIFANNSGDELTTFWEGPVFFPSIHFLKRLSSLVA